jgi:hypothetical protein
MTIAVVITNETKFGRKGSASLVILFLFNRYPRNTGTASDLKIMVSRRINARLTVLISLSCMKTTKKSRTPCSARTLM